MVKKREAKTPVGLERVRAGLEEWRGRRDRGKRIPPDLWQAATRAGRAYGVHRVSRELGLDYSCLKRRVDELCEGHRVKASADGAFIEVQTSAGESAVSCIVELEKGNGARMRICVQDAATVDWERMKEAFLGA